MYKGKGRIKTILRLCHFEFFDKGEGRHKRIQVISPWRILFGKGRRDEKNRKKDEKIIQIKKFFKIELI